MPRIGPRCTQVTITPSPARHPQVGRVDLLPQGDQPRTTAWSATRPCRARRRASPPSGSGARGGAGGGPEPGFRPDQIARPSGPPSASSATARRGPSPTRPGYKGFYYHFLDMKTGRRAWNCELSTIDTGFLIAGILTAAAYFDADEPGRGRHPRDRPTLLYRRVDWQLGRRRRADPHPRLAARIRLHPLPLARLRREPVADGPRPRIADVSLADGELCGLDLDLSSGSRSTPSGFAVFSGPLFTHQLSHIFLDLRKGIRDRLHGGSVSIDYFENSRRATYRPAGIRDPQPAPVRDVRRALLGDHRVRRPRLDDPLRQGDPAQLLRLRRPRAPHSAPMTAPSPPGRWSASLPFAPEIVLPTLAASPGASTSTWWTPTASRGASTRRTRSRGAAAAGFPPIISG